MSSEVWNERYEIGETPWEKGEAHPELPFLLKEHEGIFSTAKRTFAPGFGYGHDVALIGKLGGQVVGLDVADEPVAMASKLYPASNLKWLKGDLFTWPENESEPYDLVWEHTCFCAIDRDRRPDYVKSVQALLKPGGILAGIFFLNPDHDPNAGPPWPVSREELHQFFDPYFTLEWDEDTKETFEGREGREASMIWRKR